MPNIINQYSKFKAVIKTEGIETGIPHTFVEYDDIVKLLSRFELATVRQVETITSQRHSWHYYAEGRKP